VVRGHKLLLDVAGLDLEDDRKVVRKGLFLILFRVSSFRICYFIQSLVPQPRRRRKGSRDTQIGACHRRAAKKDEPLNDKQFSSNGDLESHGVLATRLKVSLRR
jgi:hypothetical protein